MAEIVPYTVQYPVRFYSGGDTVSEAVYKHIQEFESLYGKLTDLNTRKANSTEVDSQLNDLKKNIEDKITNISLTPGPKGAKGDKGDKGDKGEKGDGTDITVSKTNGYFTIGDKILVQWGQTAVLTENILESELLRVNFKKTFSNLFTVVTQMRAAYTPDSTARDRVVRVQNQDVNGFYYFYDVVGASTTEKMFINWLAIGN